MDINQNLTPHFKLREFLHNGSLDGVTPEILANLTRLAQALETVRTLLGNRAILITSGFRSWQHQLEVYHALGIYDEARIPKGSWHLKGLAADIIVPGMPASEVQEELKDWNGGLEYESHHTHLDLGPKRRFNAP